MRNLVGMSGRMFQTLAQGNVNIEMISQGASEINISCVIRGQDAVKALNLIHQSCLQIKPEGVRGRGVCRPFTFGGFATDIGMDSGTVALLEEVDTKRNDTCRVFVDARRNLSL